MTTLALVDEHARMGKISNNLEKHGEAQSIITGFTLPLELRIPRHQLAELMGERFDSHIWTLDGQGMQTGDDWTRRCLPFALTDETYVGVAAVLGLGGRELEFADSRVTNIQLLAFGNGGITHVKCHLYVRPGIGSENLLLQEFQEHEVAVSMSSGKLRVKADKAQQQLPLEPPAAAVDTSAQSGIPPAGADQIAAVELEQAIGEPSAAPECICEAWVRERDEHDPRCPAFVPIPIGTPEEEREKAHARERDIAQRIQDAHDNGDGPGDDDDGDDDDEAEMSGLGQQIAASSERKPPKRAGARRRSTATGDAVN
jgi:hypothetical protein